MASSSTFSGFNPPKYDVFLSFRGEDTRNNFTSHLYAALCRSNIKTFIDGFEVRKGDEISSSLSNAIQSSSLSIIVFSENYATSSWCLKELLRILECNKTKGLVILPVFYHVSPSEIRKQMDTYGEAFAKQEKSFNKMNDNFRKWRDALIEVANISGWDLTQYDRSESEFVEKIVKDVLNRLNHKSSGDHLHGLVGIASSIERVESLLCIGMTEIRIVGIWGMGGIGKTTIARAVFNRIANQFEAVCFLANVRDDAKNGLNHLREKLLFEILGEQNQNMNAFTLNRLHRKKILVVLDDVDDSEHLNILMGGHLSLFGLGSRIIITSRDRQVLKNGVDEVYKVEGLNYHEALQLFSENAFKQSHPPKDYMDLSGKVISYVKDNPLALKVLGSFLFGRTKLEWKSSLDKLKKYRNSKIQNMLRISYDGLDDNEKDIFLFIACFFKGEERDRVAAILDGCGLFTEIGISVLVDKCLLTITKNKLLMHDLIQEMGRGIVFEESVKELSERSRLWDPQDICNLFKKDTGTSAVESISLDLSQISELYLSPDTFMRMPRLKLLKLYNWHKEMDFKVQLLCEGLPDELRYLSWHGYPLKSLPIKFNPNLLVELEMYESNIQHLWKDTKFLGNLRRIGLFKCKQLTEVPDLSQAPKLQIMQLHRCCSLTKFPKISWNLNKLNLSYTAIEEVPTSAIESLNKLGTLNIRYNTSIKNLPTSMRHLTSLRSLSLDGCSNITKFPEISGEITYLSLSETAIEEVPNSAIESLSKIVTLDICHNRRLKNLPSMRRLTSLKTLILHGCSNLAKFPEISDGITDLSLSETAIENVPSFVECFTNLRRLSLNHCRRLKRVSSSIFQLKLVSSLDLTGCSQLEDLPEVLENKEKLFSLYLERSALKTLPSSIELLPQLSILVMRDCKNIESLPNSLCNLTNLSRLDLSGCSGVGKMLENVLLSSSSSCLRSLRDLILSDCNMLVLPTALSCLSSLDCLSLKGNKFESLSLTLFTSLRRLDISYCERLQYLQEFPLPSHLEYLDASHCTSLETLPDTDVVSTKICGSDQCFKYYNCWKLDEKACINIQTDAQTRIQLMANNAQVVNGRVGVKFYFPGSEIPGWISYHSEGSSLTIDLPPHWYSNKLFGFVLCIVASNESSSNQGSSIVDCKCSFIDSDNCEWQENTYLLISNGEHPKWYQKSTYVLKSNGQYPNLDRESTYLFLQSYSTLSKYSFCKKARFHFSPSKDGCKVKKCGVHLVYSELEDELCKKARFYFSPSKDGCKVKKCGLYSELEDESTESIRGGIAKEDREEEYFDSESEVINTLCSISFQNPIFSLQPKYRSSQIFSLSSSTHSTPPLNHPLPPRLPLPFFNRNSYRPVFSNEATNPGLLSVRAQIPGSDGFRSNKSVNFIDKESPIESSSSSTSSAIDFLTLCHSLKDGSILE